MEQRLAVIFNNKQNEEEQHFNCAVLVDYNKQTNTFKVKHGSFENSTEKAFNKIMGPGDFIYGNSNQMRMLNNNSDYSIYIFDNSFVERIEKEKHISKEVAHVYIVKKLSQIKLKDNKKEKKPRRVKLPKNLSYVLLKKDNVKQVWNDNIVAIKNGEETPNIGTMTIHQMLYDTGVDEAKAWYSNPENIKVIESQKEEEKIIDVELENDDIIEETYSISDIIEDISDKIVGQEEAIKTIVTNIYYNQVLIDELINDNGEIDLAELDSRKVSILLDGATGTGKTAILKEVADRLSVPLEIVSANSFSETGYVGPTITDILSNLLMQADGEIELAERGIIVLDEIDKIASNAAFIGRDMKQGVQEELLNFISGGTYDLEDPEDMMGFGTIPFDTSCITFIMMGAFTDIREKKLKELNKKPIGFSDESSKSKELTYEVTPQDYIDYGLMREFFGRIKVITNTKTYTKEDLKTILTTSKISPLINFKKTAKMQGYENMEYSDKFIDLLADKAYKMGTGARALQTIMSEIQNDMLYDLIMHQYDIDETLYITEDLLEKREKKKMRK